MIKKITIRLFSILLLAMVSFQVQAQDYEEWTQRGKYTHTQNPIENVIKLKNKMIANLNLKR